MAGLPPLPPGAPPQPPASGHPPPAGRPPPPAHPPPQSEPQQQPQQQQQEPQRLGLVCGTVRKWDDSKGFGFVTTNDGQDVFVHHTSFGGGSLTPGQVVYFDIEPAQEPGKFRAKNVSGDAVAPRKQPPPLRPAQPPPPQQPASQGQQWGQPQDQWGGQEQQEWGQPQQQQWGQPQQQQWGQPQGQQQGQAQMQRPPPPQLKPPHQQLQPQQPPSSPPTGKPETGMVKRWHDEKGFGFITAADGTDLFVHRNAIGGEQHVLEEGQAVSYVKVPDPKGGGRFRAENVTGPGVGWSKSAQEAAWQQQQAAQAEEAAATGGGGWGEDGTWNPPWAAAAAAGGWGAPAAQAAPDPNVWQQVLDPASQKHYWHNKQTNEVTWEIPAATPVVAEATQQKASNPLKWRAGVDPY